MGENKGKGTKGRNYDELTGVGTSSAGITGTTGNLNTGTRDGGIGMPAVGDSGNRAGNRQSADADDGDTTPALGRGTRSRRNQEPQASQQPRAGQSRQGGQGGQSTQSGKGGGSQQSGAQQGKQQGSRQGSQGAQGGLGRSLDQDVMGKEQ